MTDTARHGYSGKPLFQKMGLKAGMVCRVLDPPDHHGDLMTGAQGVTFTTDDAGAAGVDIVHLFVRRRADLEAKAPIALTQVKEGGALWISWPKKSSKLFEDLTEDGLREIILPLSWVDVKVCAVDTDWSGLKFVRRKSG